MIFVRDKGRMCNNILQYGHVYAWAREHNRRTISMRFAYKYPYFHICNTAGHNFFTYVCAKFAAQTGLLPTVSFHEEAFDRDAKEREMEHHRWMMVEGWYARWYDLFLKYKSDILRLFAFNDDIEAKIGKIITKKEDVLNLGVHVRRGDYATWQGGKYLYSDEQFIHLIRQVMSLSDRKVKVYICGNDPHLNRQAYIQAVGEGNIVFPNGNPGEDLCLLSHCDYLVGAPSTFTLVASMYHNTPLYWAKDIDKPITWDSFGYFDKLFKHIL